MVGWPRFAAATARKSGERKGVTLARHRIAWLPGDGIGVDVCDAAKIVLDALSLDAEFIRGEIGWACWERTGEALPAETVALLESVNCGFLGAVTSNPQLAGDRSPIIRLRRQFDLFAGLFPCKSYPGNPLNLRDDVDLVLFREHAECASAAAEFRPLPPELLALPGMRHGLDPQEAAAALWTVTRQGARRFLQRVFEYTRQRGRKKVTVVHEANVHRETDGLFLEEARRTAEEFPGIVYEEANAAAASMWLLRRTSAFDVIAVTSPFGSLLLDQAAQLAGGFGFAPSASIGSRLALFEPMHGSAPKYAGQYRVNPVAAILAARLMIEWLGEPVAARRLEDAVAAVIRDGKVRTYDMGGTHSTLEMAEEVAHKL